MLSEIDYSPLTDPASPPSWTDANAHAVQRLAEANGWGYFTHAVAQPLRGVVFREPDGGPRFLQRAVNIVRIPGDPSIEIGDSSYSEIAMGDQFTQRWGYAAVELAVCLPSMIVEARSNRARSALPATLQDAVADDRHVGLLVESVPGAEQDAAALLTPEIVGALGDAVYPFDLELTGRWLFLYAPRSLSTGDAASWMHLLATLDLLVRRAREVFPLGAGLSSGPVAFATNAHVTAPVRSRGARVNGRRVAWYLGFLAVAMASGAVATLIFGGR